MTELVQSDVVFISVQLYCLYFPELCAHLSSAVCVQFSHTMTEQCL